MKTFAERIRDEVGESANPAYYEEVLKKGDRELLEWLSKHFDDMQNTIAESMQYVGIDGCERTSHLGLRILEGNVRGMLLVIRELKARAEAITV